MTPTLRFKAFVLFCLLAAGPVAAVAAASGLDKAGADTLIHGTPRLVARQFKFTEGPASDRHGNVFFTDQPNNKVWEYRTDGHLSVFMDTAGRANGMYFDSRGNLIACADEHDQLWSIAPDRTVKVLVSGYEGKRLNGPNDVWVSPSGGIYFTDPYYQRAYWKRTHPDIATQDVYFLAKGSHAPVRAVTGLKRPNGIVGSADGRHLFVADIAGNKTYRFTIQPDGSLKDKEVFVNQGSDGLTIDGNGNLYLTGKGITIYNPQGVKIGYIAINEPWCSNVCFGGRRDNELFITASTAVYVVPMKEKGVKRRW
jgi:gluconolactonase